MDFISADKSMNNIVEAISKEEYISTVFENKNSVIVKIKGADGEGVMTAYKVLDGIYIIYNDFHTSECKSCDLNPNSLLCIDHCREGRLEKQENDGVYSYIERGDMRIDNRTNHEGVYMFPLSHYHGLTIAFQEGLAEESLKKEFPNFNINLSELSKKFICDNQAFTIHNEPTVEHLFYQLYQLPGKVQRDYFKIKVIELLLYLNGMEVDKFKVHKPYFYGGQVEKVKAIKNLVTGDLTKNYTVKELSEMFVISETALKRCFKNMYGSPIHTYIKMCRIEEATSLLFTRRDLKIADISQMVGYMSQSKFTVAFKEVMGETPLEYKKSHGLERLV